ncbi:MAG: acetate/propionate family kinase [bacterium]|nr:acetate/propionate family kinase [bacterium]
MNIIAVLNIGSSSFKYTFYDEDFKAIEKGQAEDFPDWQLKAEKYLKDLVAIGHRMVHGADKYFDPTVVNDQVFADLTEFSVLAPLHNPPALKVIQLCRQAYPEIKNVAVFDTGFYKNLPLYTRLYPIPLDIDPKIRRYGFHGTSHRYVAEESAKKLGRPLTELKIITVHLGAGCSITAIEDGQPIDTSMGFTPLEGLMMATRCGSIDPAIIFYLAREKKMSLDEIEKLLNEKSGLLGVSGVSIDPREILAVANKASDKSSPEEKEQAARAGLALQMYAYRVKKYIGAYFVALGGLDALVFTGKVGENSELIREMITNGLGGLGKFTVLVIPTDEELAIARQVASLLLNLQPKD